MSYTYEIGLALEPPLALLTVVFCADTYVQEISSKRSEIARLYPIKNRMASIGRRMGAQETYLLLLAAFGYGMFYIFQKPVSFYGEKFGADEEWYLFLVYMAAIVVTLLFWGILSLALSCVFRNMWAGIGICLVLWLITDSTIGERFLRKWNLFSYTFRNIENRTDSSWVCGKIICIVCCMIMAAVLPQIVKNRG